MDHLKSFFSTTVEMDLERIYNISVGQIVMLLDDPDFQNGSFDEKWNSVVDLFAQGLLEKRESIKPDDDIKQDNGRVSTLATAWERKEHTDLLIRRAMVASMSSKKENIKQDNGRVSTLATAWERKEHTDLLVRRAMVESISKRSRRSVLADQDGTFTIQPSNDPGNYGAR